jgi:hypothetical protein
MRFSRFARRGVSEARGHARVYVRVRGGFGLRRRSAAVVQLQDARARSLRGGAEGEHALRHALLALQRRRGLQSRRARVAASMHARTAARCLPLQLQGLKGGQRSTTHARF